MAKAKKNIREDKRTDIRIKVVPRSSRNEIVGKEGDVYKVKVTSPPADGKANKALIEFLARRLGIPKTDIEIASGKTSRLKSVRVFGLSQKDIGLLLDL